MKSSLFLTGYMGAGKSTVGKLLSQGLQLPFFDLDDEIERVAGIAISDIFERYGEEHFRNLETELLIAGHPAAVIALGGGSITSEAIRKHVRSNGKLLYLAWPIEVLFQRVQHGSARPLAKSFVPFKERYLEREKWYAAADFVWTSQPPHHERPEEIVSWVLSSQNFGV